MFTITSFSYICIMWMTLCVDLLSAESEVTGFVGSTAVLPCKLRGVDTEIPYIRWRIKTQTVFERWGEETDQGEGYEGRVDVPEDELHNGDCSLLLNNLTLTDEAVYESYLIVSLTRTKRSLTKKVPISIVRLHVSPPKETHRDVPPPPTGLTPGGTAAVIIGVIIVLILGIVLFIYWKKRKGDAENSPIKTDPE